jgi:hypothetical protein
MATSVDDRIRNILWIRLERWLCWFPDWLGYASRLRTAPRSSRPWERACCQSDFPPDRNEDNARLLRPARARRRRSDQSIL